MRRGFGELGGAGECGGHVRGARGLVRPFHGGLREERRLGVGEQGLHREHGTDLLAGGDHHGGAVGAGVEDGAHGVPGAGAGVQVHQGGGTGGEGEAVGHADHDRLLEAQYVPEVFREPLEHGQFGRSGIAEHRGHATGPENIQDRFSNRAHVWILPPDREQLKVIKTPRSVDLGKTAPPGETARHAHAAWWGRTPTRRFTVLTPRPPDDGGVPRGRPSVHLTTAGRHVGPSGSRTGVQKRSRVRRGRTTVPEPARIKKPRSSIRMRRTS